MNVFSRIDSFFLRFFGVIGLKQWYVSHDTFRVFVKYTVVMGLGFLGDIPLIFLFLDVFKWHWVVSMSLSAFIVHVAKFLVNKVWVFE